MTPEEKIKDLANCYARVFLASEDGKRVLADLRRKFGVTRLSFPRNPGHRQDAIDAAIIDGERGVMLHVEGALTLGAPDQGLTGFLP